MPLLKKIARNSAFLFLAGTLLTLAVQITPRPPTSLVFVYVTLAFQFLVAGIALFQFKLRLSTASRSVLLAWFALFFYALLSAYWSEFPYLTIRRTLLVFVPGILLLLLTYSDRTPRKTFVAVAAFLSYAGAFLAFVGLALFFWGELEQMSVEMVQSMKIGPLEVAQVVKPAPFSLWRISSLTGNPNYLGMLLFFTISVTQYLLLARYMKRRWAYALLGVQSVALFLTFSRAGIGATLASSAAIYVLRSERQKGRAGKVVVALAAFAALGLFLFQTGAGSSVLGLFGQRYNTLTHRGIAWEALLNGFQEHPLRGLGFGVAIETTLRTNLITLSGGHNSHLTFLAEMGSIAYIVFLGMWGAAIVLGLRRHKQAIRAGRDYFLPSIAVAVLSALLFHQLFENVIPRFEFGYFFWLYLIGFVTHPRLRYPARQRRATANQLPIVRKMNTVHSAQ